MSTNDMVKKSLSAEKIVTLLIFAGYAFVSLALFPAVAPSAWQVSAGGEDYFQAIYAGLQAFVIAYPLADRFLKGGRYVLFFTLAAATLGVFAYVDEVLIERYLFADRGFLWAAIYYEAAETGTLAALILAARLLWARHESERRLEQLARASAEAELRYLKAQINPHVLFNALNNIYSFALQKSEATPGLILKLADILRYMIYDCDGDATPLDREISYLRDYVDIQKLAVEGRGKVEFGVSGDPEDKRLAPFLLIPFIENCFKHSMDTQEQAIDISISIEIGEDRLRLQCRNLYDPSAARGDGGSSSAGVGLANARRRLDLLFEDDYELDITDSNGAFCVDLRAPLQ